jgi:hypothetical protein
MKSTFKIFGCIIILSMALLACGAEVKGLKPAADADRRTLAEVTFTPLDSQNDEAVITSDVPEAKESNGESAIEYPPEKQVASRQTNQYFSVQIFASKSNTEARDFQNSVSSLFENDEIRIDYQAPYYRVCIGKSADFEQAEELLNKVNDMGFPQAWLVRIRK